MSDLFAFGIGHATHNRAGQPLEVLFPAPCKNPSAKAAAAVLARLKPGVSSRLTCGRRYACPIACGRWCR